MKKKVAFAFLVAVLLAWSLLLWFVGPSSIVSALGVNIYVAVYVAGVLGGTSILFPFPYYLVVVTAVAGGANPWIVGLMAGLGVATGDATSYAFGRVGRVVLPRRAEKIFSYVQNWSNARGAKFFAFLYAYGAVMPLPNDVIVIPLGIARIPFWRVIIPFTLGNITFNVALALLASAGFQFFI